MNSPKQVRVKKPETIEGMLVDDWIRQNADDIWLTQNGMYDVLDVRQRERDRKAGDAVKVDGRDESDTPF